MIILGEYHIDLTRVPNKSLSKNIQMAVTPLVLPPICPFPNLRTVDFRNLIVFLLGRDPGTLKSDIVSKKHSQLICSDLRLSICKFEDWNHGNRPKANRLLCTSLVETTCTHNTTNHYRRKSLTIEGTPLLYKEIPYCTRTSLTILHYASAGLWQRSAAAPTKSCLRSCIMINYY